LVPPLAARKSSPSLPSSRDPPVPTTTVSSPGPASTVTGAVMAGSLPPPSVSKMSSPWPSAPSTLRTPGQL
jgi:hypothetical protein